MILRFEGRNTFVRQLKVIFFVYLPFSLFTIGLLSLGLNDLQNTTTLLQNMLLKWDHFYTEMILVSAPSILGLYAARQSARDIEEYHYHWKQERQFLAKQIPNILQILTLGAITSFYIKAPGLLTIFTWLLLVLYLHSQLSPRSKGVNMSLVSAIKLVVYFMLAIPIAITSRTFLP